jgi:choline dehydrogenase-like flavoprotein
VSPGWGKSGMRANDPDVVVDAGVAGASIAAVLARGGSKVLLLVARTRLHREAFTYQLHESLLAR